jgi:hypothetical protein
MAVMLLPSSCCSTGSSAWPRSLRERRSYEAGANQLVTSQSWEMRSYEVADKHLSVECRQCNNPQVTGSLKLASACYIILEASKAAGAVHNCTPRAPHGKTCMYVKQSWCRQLFGWLIAFAATQKGVKIHESALRLT